MRHRFNVILLISTAFVLPTTTQAQTAQPTEDQSSAPSQGEGGDIIVTATRSEQRLRDVPLSVAAFSPQALENRQVRRIDDIARLTPGVNFTRSSFGNGAASNIAIRGVSSNVGAATTGIYVDDTPIQVRQIGFTAANAYPNIFDLARVEVLRGPQGTLFGAGAQGGTVRFISPEPSLSKWSAYGRAELSSTKEGAPSWEEGAAFGGPLVEGKLGFRASAYFRRDGGWVEWAPLPSRQVADENANSQKSFVARAALAWEPISALRITPSVMYQWQRTNDTVAYWEKDSDTDAGRYRNNAPNQAPSRDRFVLPALKIVLDLGNTTLTSNTSYFHRKVDAIFDYTGVINATFGASAEPPASIPNYSAISDMRNRQENFTQEVRLQSDFGRFKLVAGAFYSWAKQNSYQATIDPFFAQLTELTFKRTVQQVFGVPLLPGNIGLLNINQGIDTQLAGFGQADWEALDGLTLTAGVRVSRTKFKFKTHQDGPGAGGLLDYSGDQTETPVTPKFGISYKPNSDLMVYASASKGFRIGGVNTPIRSLTCQPDLASLGLTSAPLEYKSDTVWNYEVGAKGATPNGVLSFEASLFRINWSGIQTNVRLPSCALRFTYNVGKARSQGADLVLTAAPLEGLSLTAAVGYVDAQYDETVTSGAGAKAIGIVQKGDKLPGSPFTLSLSGRYEAAVDSSRKAFVQIDYDYRNRLKDLTPERDPANFGYDKALITPEAFNNLNAQVGFTDGNLQLAVFGNNILNNQPIFSRTHQTTRDPIFLVITPRPRTVGVRASYRY